MRGVTAVGRGSETRECGSNNIDGGRTGGVTVGRRVVKRCTSVSENIPFSPYIEERSLGGYRGVEGGHFRTQGTLSGSRRD